MNSMSHIISFILSVRFIYLIMARLGMLRLVTIVSLRVGIIGIFVIISFVGSVWLGIFHRNLTLDGMMCSSFGCFVMTESRSCGMS